MLSPITDRLFKGARGALARPSALAPRSSPLFSRSHKVVALDWDARTLKAVEATIGSAGLKVQRVISAHIPGDVKCAEPDSFGAFIKSVLRDKKIGASQALLAVPRDKTILINLRLPQAPVGELSSMVKLQASRELPFSADEAVMDFAGSQAHDAPEFLDLTVGAIQQEAMAFYKQLAHAAGLHLMRLGLRPNSNLVGVTRGQHPFSDDRILFVDIGAQATEISIFRWGRLTFSRTVGIDLTSQTEQDSACRNLLLEVLRTVEAYRASDTSKLDQVIVAGDTGREAWLADALRSRFSSPASLYDPTWTVEVDKDLAQGMTGFCATLGLLVGQTVPEIGRFDFVAPKHPADMKAIRRRQVTIGATVAIALLLVVWLVSGMYVRGLQAESTQLQAQIDVLDKKVKEDKLIGDRVKSVQKWTNQEMVWVDIFKQVVDQLPDNKDGYVTKLQVKGQNRQIDLGMRVANMMLPNDLWTRLNALNGIGCEIRSSRERVDPKYPFEADLIIRIDPPGAKPVSAKNKPGPKAPQTQVTRSQMVERPER